MRSPNVCHTRSGEPFRQAEDAPRALGTVGRKRIWHKESRVFRGSGPRGPFTSKALGAVTVCKLTFEPGEVRERKARFPEAPYSIFCRSCFPWLEGAV